MKEKPNLIRNDIAQELQNDVGSFIEARRFTDVFFDVLGEEITQKDEFKIHGFGVFRCIQKKSRIGRNPKTLEEAEIKPRRVVSFIAGGTVKSKIISGRREKTGN